MGNEIRTEYNNLVYNNHCFMLHIIT